MTQHHAKHTTGLLAIAAALLLSACGAQSSPEGAAESYIKTVCSGDIDHFRAISPWTLAEQAAPVLREHATVIRHVVGTQDDTRELNLAFHQRLEQVGIEHDYREIADVGHDARAVLAVLARTDGGFYQRALGTPVPLGGKDSDVREP